MGSAHENAFRDRGEPCGKDSMCREDRGRAGGFSTNFVYSLSRQEYECLEQENAVLRREIGKLTEELKHLSEALKEHEKMCPLLLCPMNFVPVPRPDPVPGCLPR